MKTFATALWAKSNSRKCVFAAVKHCAVAMQKPIPAWYACILEPNMQAIMLLELKSTVANSEDY
jgi:hypothetical protein